MSHRVVHRTVEGIRTGERPPPAVGDGLLLRVTSAGICGSDLHAARTREPNGVVPGHEFGGVLDDGRLVAVRPILWCGACSACSGGRPQVCPHLWEGFSGMSVDGGLADEVVVRPEQVVDVPSSVDPRHVALVEPIAVAVHAVGRGLPLPDRALVIGGGSIGLLCAAVLADRGVTVDVALRHDAQRRAADALGVGTQPDGPYELVVEAAGSPSSFEQAQKAVARGGCIVLVALPWEPLAIGMPTVLREVDVRSAVFYSDADFVAAADALARHPEWVDAVVTHRFGLDEAAAAYATAEDRAAGAVKVHLLP